MPFTALLRSALATVAAVVVALALTAGDSPSTVPATAPAAAPAAAPSAQGRASQTAPAPDSTWARGAATALMGLYDRRTGLWRSTGWWNSANALTSLIDYMRATGDRRYLWVVANTFDRNRTVKDGDFVNKYLDDTGWWALAWIRAYDLTHQRRYLRTARIDVDDMWQHHDNACGGGVWWRTDHKYKNAITNELFIKAAAELHTRMPGDTAYLRKSLTTWRWFRGSGLINAQGLVNDGLDADSCRNNGGTTWTYNQGVVLGALVDLARATHRQRYLRQAATLADASTGAAGLHVDGVLTEPCEATDCGADGPSFKGAFVRNLGELAEATSSKTYRSYLRRQAVEAHDCDRAKGDRYGVHWAGPVRPTTSATQQSALDLMLAALR